VRCRFRVRSTGNRPADYQVIRPGANGFPRRSDTCLIVRPPPPPASSTVPDYRADSRNHNQEVLPAGTPNRADFVRGRHNAVHAGLLSKAGQLDCTLRSRARYPYRPQCGVIHARQDRYRQQLCWRAMRASGPIPGICSRAHHFQAPQGMQVHKLDPRQANGACDGSLDSVWDIMKFQVQEYAWSKGAQFFHCGRAFGSE
jgi:hypothetical protein